MKKMLRIVAIAMVCVAGLQLTGCAQMTMGQPQANLPNVAKLRSIGMEPVHLGAFKAAPGTSSSFDKEVGVRGGNTLGSPVEGSFAQYLRATLKADLESAGLLNPASPSAVTATLSANELDAGIGTGTGKLGARFVVTRAGATRFDKTVAVDASWESSFVGAIAIPMAKGEYEGLYRKLVAKLIDDADFRKAVAQ